MEQEKEILIDELAIAQKLIERDPQTTEKFYREGCAGMFSYIIKHLYPNGSNVEREEMINDFYWYLMKEDAAVLRIFQGKSKLTTYLRQIAIRYFSRQKDKDKERWIAEKGFVLGENPKQKESNTKEQKTSDKIRNKINFETVEKDICDTLERMSDKRSSYLIRRLYLDEYPAASVAQELDVPIATFYVLKQRALIKFKAEYLQIRNERYE